MSRHLASAAALAVALTCLPATASAVPRTRLVDDAPSAQCPNARYRTIQDAVDAAGSGDVILICEGTYAGDVSIPAVKGSLKLEPQSKRPVTIDGNLDVRAPLWLLSSMTVHGDIHITGARVRAIIRMTVDGGGITATEGSVRYLSDNRITAGGGPAISMTTSGRFGIGQVTRVGRNIVQGGSVGIELAQGDCEDAHGQALVLSNRVTGAGTGLSVTCVPTLALNNAFVDGGTGIHFGAGAGSFLTRNVAFGNSGDGIVLDGQTGARLRLNRANGNGGTDCVDTSTGIATLGTANRWILNAGDDASPAGLCGDLPPRP